VVNRVSTIRELSRNKLTPDGRSLTVGPDSKTLLHMISRSGQYKS